MKPVSAGYLNRSQFHLQLESYRIVQKLTGNELERLSPRSSRYTQVRSARVYCRIFTSHCTQFCLLCFSIVLRSPCCPFFSAYSYLSTWQGSQKSAEGVRLQLKAEWNIKCTITRGVNPGERRTRPDLATITILPNMILCLQKQHV